MHLHQQIGLYRGNIRLEMKPASESLDHAIADFEQAAKANPSDQLAQGQLQAATNMRQLFETLKTEREKKKTEQK